MINPFFKFATLFLPLITVSIMLSATDEFCSELTQCPSSQCISRPLFEVKTGYFFFSNSQLRKIYDKGGFDIQLCASYPLWNLTNGWTLNGYGAIEYFHRSGKSINAHQRTSIWSVPINLGLKPVYTISAHTQYYFAIGPRYFYVHQHNHSTYVYKSKSKNGLGFFVNTGFNYLLCNHFVIDIFGEYSYGKTHFHTGNSRIYTKAVQIGGFTFGGGLGYEF